MGVDLRQVVAGALTLTMFVMLGNMIKRDHFDSVEVSSTTSHFPLSLFLSVSRLFMPQLIHYYLHFTRYDVLSYVPHPICFTFLEDTENTTKPFFIVLLLKSENSTDLFALHCLFNE